MLAALLGGALIGLAATWFWFANGRVAGVSGIVSGALRSRGDERGDARKDRILFLAGLGVAGVLAMVASPAGATLATPPVVVLLAAGLLVGFGTRLSGGCTSGHGVCGLSRFSVSSLVAVVTFMAMAAVTVFVVAHLLPEWRPR